MQDFLYVSTDLCCFPAADDTALALDIGQDDDDRFRCYRRLDLAWFTYLANKMAKLRSLDDDGQADPSSVSVMLSTRWAVVIAFAVTAFGRDAIEQAAATPPDDRYETPKVRKGSALLPIVPAAASLPRTPPMGLPGEECAKTTRYGSSRRGPQRAA